MRALTLAAALVALCFAGVGCSDSDTPADSGGGSADAGVDRGLPDAPRPDTLAGDGPKAFDPCTGPTDCPAETSCGPLPQVNPTPCRLTSTRYCRPGVCSKFNGVAYTPACQPTNKFCVRRCEDKGPAGQCPTGLTCAQIGQSSDYGCQPL